MAAYDLPSSVDYILHSTGASSLGYVGHSQGTTMGFAALSSQPQLAQKVSCPQECCTMASTSKSFVLSAYCIPVVHAAGCMCLDPSPPLTHDSCVGVNCVQQMVALTWSAHSSL